MGAGIQAQIVTFSGQALLTHLPSALCSTHEDKTRNPGPSTKSHGGDNYIDKHNMTFPGYKST